MSDDRYPCEVGTWCLVSPSGRVWRAEHPLKCVSIEANERIPAAVQLERIFAAAEDDPLEIAAKEVLAVFSNGYLTLSQEKALDALRKELTL